MNNNLPILNAQSLKKILTKNEHQKYTNLKKLSKEIPKIGTNQFTFIGNRILDTYSLLFRNNFLKTPNDVYIFTELFNSCNTTDTKFFENLTPITNDISVHYNISKEIIEYLERRPSNNKSRFLVYIMSYNYYSGIIEEKYNEEVYSIDSTNSNYNFTFYTDFVKYIDDSLYQLLKFINFENHVDIGFLKLIAYEMYRIINNSDENLIEDNLSKFNNVLIKLLKTTLVTRLIELQTRCVTINYNDFNSISILIKDTIFDTRKKGRMSLFHVMISLDEYQEIYDYVYKCNSLILGLEGNSI